MKKTNNKFPLPSWGGLGWGLLLMAFAIAAHAQDRVVGALVWPKNQAGLYDVDVESGKLTRRVVDSEMFGLMPGGAYGQAAVRRDNLYYVTNYFTQDRQICVYHAVYDLNTNKRLWIKRNGLIAAAPMDMAYCEEDGKTYGCFHCPEGLGEAYVFGTLNLETFEVTRIKLLSQKWLAMACAPDGTLYALNASGVLVKVDKETGNTQLVAQTEVPVYFDCSAAISNDGDAMYLNVTDLGGSYLMVIDLHDGHTVSTHDYSVADGEVLGLVILEEEDEDAPAVAPRFEVPACQMATKVAASWDMPDYGTSMTATITMDGNEVYRKQHAAGATVTTELNARLTGYHTFTLRLNGSSPTSVRRWVGEDTPLAPQNVQFTRTGNTNTLTWDAVTGSVNDGYMDASKITYSIYRYPGGQLVAGSLKTTTWSEEFAEPESLTTMHYAVEAVVGGSGARSEKAESNSISFSSIQPPYSQTFDEGSSLEAYTIIDGNKDGETWHWADYSKKVRIFASDTQQLNDWLISPAVTLEAGKYYEFSLDLHGFKRSTTEFFEIACGRSNTAAAMTTSLLGETALSADNNTKFTVGLVAPESGQYYFGLHATSPAGTQYIYTDNWCISEGKAPAMPSPATGLKLTRAPLGHIKVDVDFTLPTTTMGGDALTDITKVEVIRSGYDKIKEYTDVKPGQKIQFTDEPFSTNFYRYSVYVYNAAGVSPAAEALEYVGPYAPAQPSDFKVRRSPANDGEVVMSWHEPTTDKNGDELDPELITYTVAAIVDGAPKYIVEKRPIIGFTYQEQPAGLPQKFVTYALYAQTEGGSSTKLESTPCPVGVPYTTPFAESFAGGDALTVWYPEDVFGLSMWDYATDETLGYIESFDNDNGFVYAQALQSGNTSTLNSGLITITGEAPVLEFHYWSQGLTDRAKTTVQLIVDDEIKTLGTINHAADDGWQTATVSLADYVGKDVQLKLLAQFGTERLVAYDNIRIMSDVSNNLSLSDVVIPADAQAGMAFTVSAVVQNNGKTDVAGTEYATVLKRDGKEVQRKRGFGTLRTGKTANVTFSETLSVLDEGTHSYKVVVEYDDDQMLSDNQVEGTVVCFVPDFPVPVAGQIAELGNDQGVRVEWNTPVEPEEQPVTTENFESYDGAQRENIGGWTLVDRDKNLVNTIGGLPIPGIVAGQTWMSYIIVDNTADEKLKSITAHSGNKVLLSIFSSKGQNDDWLISPPLSGHAQTVSLWAHSGSASYREAFQLMTTDKYSVNPSDYKELDYDEKVPAQWTEYNFNLPEGTKHFAVRCISNNAYYFTLDDISYVSDLHSTADLIGYNIYCDGVKLNSELVESLSYGIAAEASPTATYLVTAVYHKGESRAVEIATRVDGINTISSDKADSIYDLAGRRIMHTTKGINIINGNKVIK